jgi:hypothetical protein
MNRGNGLYLVAVVDPLTFTYSPVDYSKNPPVNVTPTTPPPASARPELTIRKRYDGVRGDFEEQFLQPTRISNLITTRSDSFTCYILVQGYRNANTANPKLEVQKRVAYIIDRSKYPYKPVEKILVPND